MANQQQQRISELTDFQEWAMTKARDYETDAPAGEHSALLNGALGLSGETGELANNIKKIAFHNKELTDDVREMLCDELGDVLWYVAFLASALDYTLEQVADANRFKLDERYPDGFDSDRAPSIRY